MEKADIVISASKAAFAAIPVVGGPIASLIGDFIPTSTQKNIQATLEMLKESVKIFGKGKVSSNIIIGYIDSGIFTRHHRNSNKCYGTSFKVSGQTG